MKWTAKRYNKHLLIHNFCYFKDYSIGVLIGKTDLGFAVQFDLIFIGITIII